MADKFPLIIDGVVRIPKVAITRGEYLRLLEELTLTYKPPEGGMGQEKIVYCLQEENGWLSIPRQYGMNRFGRDPRFQLDDRRVYPSANDVRMLLPLDNSSGRDQVKFVDKFIKEIELNGLGAIGCARPGFGKTVCACALIEHFKTPVIIFVRKSFLMNQWRERIQQFLGIETGHVQQDICDFRDRRIVLAMVQSLASRRYEDDLYTSFGLAIHDEVHGMSCETWDRASRQFNTKYNAGISATPRRSDKLENVFFWNIGPIAVRMLEQPIKPNVYRICFRANIPKHEIGYPQTRRGRTVWKLNQSKAITILTNIKERTEWIAEEIVKSARAGRKMLILSDRLDHLREMKDLTDAELKSEPIRADFYIGGRKQEDLDKAAECEIIYATFAMAKEALDIPTLDTLFMTTPKSDVEQAVGRIQRPHEGKKHPLVVDICDTVDCFYGGQKKRLYFYRANGFNVTDVGF